MQRPVRRALLNQLYRPSSVALRRKDEGVAYSWEFATELLEQVVHLVRVAILIHVSGVGFAFEAERARVVIDDVEAP